MHSRPVDIKVGNHPHGLSPCGKPIDCAHSAVLQSGDLLGFVERVVHVMQTEICLILHSHSPLLSSAWAFGCGKKRNCTANMLTSHNLPPCDTLYFVGGSAWGWYIRHHTAVQCRSIYHARPIPSRGKKSPASVNSLKNDGRQVLIFVWLNNSSRQTQQWLSALWSFFFSALKFHLVLTVGVSSGLVYCVHKFNLLLFSLRPSQSPCYDWLINCTIWSMCIDI